MRIMSFILAFLYIVLFACAVTGIGLGGFLENTVMDIQSNIQLSIPILFFLLLSVVFDVFYNKKPSDNFLAGTLAGLGIATFFTGFSGSIGFGIIIYSILIRDASNEIHNKSRNSDAISSADS